MKIKVAMVWGVPVVAQFDLFGYQALFIDPCTQNCIHCTLIEHSLSSWSMYDYHILNHASKSTHLPYRNIYVANSYIRVHTSLYVHIARSSRTRNRIMNRHAPIMPIIIGGVEIF